MPAVPPARQDVNSEAGSTPPDERSRSESELERRPEAMPTSVSAPEPRPEPLEYTAATSPWAAIKVAGRAAGQREKRAA